MNYIPINMWLRVTSYLSLLLVAIVALISAASYSSVYLTFGTVPSSADFTRELIGDSGRMFTIFSKEIGRLLIVAYLWSLLFWIVVVPAVLALKFFRPKFELQKKLLTIVVVVNLTFFLAWAYTDVFGWYSLYVLD